jgi:hypothetical protein
VHAFTACSNFTSADCKLGLSIQHSVPYYREGTATVLSNLIGFVNTFTIISAKRSRTRLKWKKILLLINKDIDTVFYTHRGCESTSVLVGASEILFGEWNGAFPQVPIIMTNIIVK